MTQRRRERSVPNFDILDFVPDPAGGGGGGERLFESTFIGNTCERTTINPQSFHDYGGG